MQSTLFCLVHDLKRWYSDMIGLREHAPGPIQRFHQNFIKVSLIIWTIDHWTSKLCYWSTRKLCIYTNYMIVFENSAWMYYIESSIMVNTCRTGSACQSNTASSMPSNPWVLSNVGITCASTLGHVVSTVLCIYILFHHFFIAYLILFYCISFLIIKWNGIILLQRIYKMVESTMLYQTFARSCTMRSSM
jgi:hypothetical protein